MNFIKHRLTSSPGPLARFVVPGTALLLVLLAHAAVPQVAQADLSQFRLVGCYADHSYYVSISPMTWNEANTLCQSIPGGNLATIADSSENAFVAGCDLDGTNTGLWIGLTDEGHEDVWTWVTGEPLTYLNWDIPYGQPQGGEGENVVSMKPDHMPNSPGMWHDQNANSVSLLCVLEVTSCPPNPIELSSWGKIKRQYR
jgi:hypothetical protein